MINRKSGTVVAAGVVAVVIIIFGARFVMGQWIINQNEKTLLTIDLQIAEQELLLVTVADLARRTEADEITNRIIVDCIPEERMRFDTLLDSLSTEITSSELQELDTLFYKCGSFYSDRKAVMAARLYREVEIYTDYIKLRSSLISIEDQGLQERASLWLKLADSELIFADYFTTLTKLQGDIITALLSGQRRDSESIIATLKEVNETRIQMTILSRQIENYRDSMQSL